MKKLRACPICPKCGSKKFERLNEKDKVRVKCIKCKDILSI